MLHPIGSHPPGVYWRRRLALFIALVALIGLSAWVLRPAAGKKGHVAGSSAHPQQSSSRAALATSKHPTSGSATSEAPSGAGSSSGASPACSPEALKVAAVVQRPSYRVGEQPMVLLQVTNAGPAPCVQDLADSQIELRVYNGESRVWGSHDCTVQPGIASRTLAVGQPVRVSIVWSGLSSQPNCAGTRQRVGAGTYTLYALLSGHEGTAAQFSVS